MFKKYSKYWKVVDAGSKYIHLYPIHSRTSRFDDYYCIKSSNPMYKRDLELCMEKLTYERIKWLMIGDDLHQTYYEYKDGELMPTSVYTTTGL